MVQSKGLIQFNDKVRLELNKLLNEVEEIQTEAQKQDGARVPEMEHVISRCSDCIDRIKAFKEVNFPGKK